jgi:uncharacterized protein YdiU (UPF0061 family)
MAQDSIWNFDNSYLSLPSVFFSETSPTAISDPELLLYNSNLAKQLGLTELAKNKAYLTDVLAGNHVPKSTTSIAQAYGGHQFGHFNVLGDGRAILIGEIITPYEERFDIQLKGSGQTPYSRRGDGRSTLYSMLREYLISEAMAGLNISTTRSLAIVRSDDPVYRQTVQQTGVLTRVAESHIRVGTFELAVRMGNPDFIKKLFSYTADRHYPDVFDTENPALSFLQEVIQSQIKLVNDWLKVGFIHGVMNTDNMSIAGETIDYGPCAFMNHFDPLTVYSSIDEQGRYAYSNQSKIAKWNLMRLAETLLPLIHSDEKKSLELAQKEFDQFDESFQTIWKINHLAKLGIIKEEDGDEDLLNELFAWMETAKPDFNNTFRGLVDPHLHNEPVFNNSDFQTWKAKWLQRVSSVDNYENLLEDYNPSVIPRNHLVEEALIQASEDENMTPFNELLAKLQSPFEHYTSDKYQQPPSSENFYQNFCGT